MKAREILLRERRANRKEFDQILNDEAIQMGFECEMLLPSTNGEEDFDSIDPDEHDWSEVQEYVDDDRERASESFYEWCSGKVGEAWEERRTEYTEQYCIDEDLIKPLKGRKLSARAQAKRDAIIEENYEAANEKFYEEEREDIENDLTYEEWIDDEYGGSITRMMSALNLSPKYGWNHAGKRIFTDEDSYAQDPVEATHQECAYSIENDLGVDIRVSDDYHGDDKRDGIWYIEPDSSISNSDKSMIGAEVVSPPYPVGEAIDYLKQFFDWMDEHGAQTDASTGLHINLSREGHNEDDYDYLKMIIMFDENHTAQLFGRLNNHYSEQMRQKLTANIAKITKGDPTTIDARTVFASSSKAVVLGLLKQLGRGLVSHFNKYFAINNRDNGVFEFRGMGGAGYESKFEDIRKEVVQMANVLRIGSDPDLYAQEYITKVFSLLNLGKYANAKPGSGQRDKAVPQELAAFAPMINRDQDLAVRLEHEGITGFIAGVAKRVAVGRFKLDRQQAMTIKRALLRSKIGPEAMRKQCRDDNAYNVLASLMRWQMALGASEDDRQATLPFATPGEATPPPNQTDYGPDNEGAHFTMPHVGDDPNDRNTDDMPYRVRRDWADRRRGYQHAEVGGGLGDWDYRNRRNDQ